MHAFVVTDARLLSDGQALVSRSGRAYSFWSRYLSSFDNITVVARIEPIAQLSGECVEGPGVSVWGLPPYSGAMGYLNHWKQLRRHAASIVEQTHSRSLVIVRAPSFFGGLLIDLLRTSGRPYVMEVIGDPALVFSPGASDHPFRPILRAWCTRRLRRECADASAVAYVTAGALQERYPAHPAAITSHYSSAELPLEAFAQGPKAPPVGRPLKLVAVGSLAQPYKGYASLLRVLPGLLKSKTVTECTIVGGGRYEQELRGTAESFGILANVHFAGHVPSGSEVYAYLDRADLFVHPSLAEGLPRSVLEAMARGLPCVATDVGGTRELLGQYALIEPGDDDALARSIQRFATDSALFAQASLDNLNVAQAYSQEAMRSRQAAFLAEASRFRALDAPWPR